MHNEIGNSAAKYTCPGKNAAISKHAQRVLAERASASSRHISTSTRYQHAQAMTSPAVASDRPVTVDSARRANGYPGNQLTVPQRYVPGGACDVCWVHCTAKYPLRAMCTYSPLSQRA